MNDEKWISNQHRFSPMISLPSKGGKSDNSRSIFFKLNFKIEFYKNRKQIYFWGKKTEVNYSEKAPWFKDGDSEGPSVTAAPRDNEIPASNCILLPSPLCHSIISRRNLHFPPSPPQQRTTTATWCHSYQKSLTKRYRIFYQQKRSVLFVSDRPR